METNGAVLVEPTLSSKSIEILGSKIHYLEAGQGDPMLFIHGMPTSSHLWRKVIPYVSDEARCIAPDLIGMGQSDKPDIEYRVFDHIRYIENFIEKMKLTNITLVLHGWGSVVGFAIASRHPEKIKALVFYEAHIRPESEWRELSLPVQQFASLLSRQGASYRAIVKQNYLVEKLLPSGIIRHLSEEEMEAYRAPFKTPESRKPLWQYVQDLPLGNGPADVLELIRAYSQWLCETPIPKLMFYAVPGFITTMDAVQWAKTHLKNLSLESFDDALHFVQESYPELFGDKLQKWYSNLQ
jgi:haloalkane dehalogenase